MLMVNFDKAFPRQEQMTQLFTSFLFRRIIIVGTFSSVKSKSNYFTRIGSNKKIYGVYPLMHMRRLKTKSSNKNLKTLTFNYENYFTIFQHFSKFLLKMGYEVEVGVKSTGSVFIHEFGINLISCLRFVWQLKKKEER